MEQIVETIRGSYESDCLESEKEEGGKPCKWRKGLRERLEGSLVVDKRQEKIKHRLEITRRIRVNTLVLVIQVQLGKIQSEMEHTTCDSRITITHSLLLFLDGSKAALHRWSNLNPERYSLFSKWSRAHA